MRCAFAPPACVHCPRPCTARPLPRWRFLTAGLALVKEQDEAVGGTREQASGRIADDIAKWTRLVRAIGYRPE